MSRTRAAGSQSDRRHHRQPEREKRRKRGACIDPHGYDAGKKIKGKKRHILVDTLGLLLHAIVHPADIQDRDGGVLVMATLFGMFPFLKTLFADRDRNLREELQRFCRISTLKSSSVPMNGMCVLSTGRQWRAIPKDLPPRSTLFHYLDLWSWDGTIDRIHHALYVGCREQDDREASPTAAIIDSQSVKSAEKGGPASIRMAMMRARKSRARSATFS